METVKAFLLSRWDNARKRLRVVWRENGNEIGWFAFGFAVGAFVVL